MTNCFHLGLSVSEIPNKDRACSALFFILYSKSFDFYNNSCLIKQRWKTRTPYRTTNNETRLSIRDKWKAGNWKLCMLQFELRKQRNDKLGLKGTWIESKEWIYGKIVKKWRQWRRRERASAASLEFEIWVD